MKIFLLFVVLQILAFSSATKKWNQLDNYNFVQYIEEFEKEYSVEEYSFREKIFEERLKSIRIHNENPSFSWKKGINYLSDRTPEEFKKLLGYKKDLAYRSKEKQKKNLDYPIVDLSSLPASIDWRDKGVVTSVKDQGQCGSCWSFGTTEVIESHFALSTGVLFDLSEQEILDCTPNPNDCGGIGGCGGGTPELAYSQILKIGGLTSEWMYPYISWSGKNYDCRLNTSHVIPYAVLSGFEVLPSNQLAPVLQALANKGPLAVNVDASAWSEYESGVFDGCNQTNPDINHVVQLVGYGTDKKFGDYWIIRNSWTPFWGENGYIRIRRTSTPRCGIDLKPSDGTGCNDGPSQVTVCGTCAILYDVSYPVIAKKN